jgi:PKD repeat protein
MICTPGVEENYQNFMDYSYCSHMFTIGQANRIYAALGSTTAGRNNLWSASNLAATGLSSNPVVCAPLADFTPATPTLLCAGSTAQYKYLLMNGQPSTWSWTFPGGTPSVSTDSFPLIQYNTPGTYSVTLTVSNANGSNSRTRTGLVIVSPTTAQYATTSYSEGFENSATVGADWIFLAPYGNPWARTTTAAATGTASLKLKNSTDLKGEVTTAISPSIDFAGIPSPALTFKVAFALKATGNADRLTVGFSADCGKTWLLRYFKSGSALATAPVTTGSFVPTSAQWRLETISMSAVNTYSNARVKFEMLTDAGNDIYVDDINVASSFNGILEEAAGVNNLLLYPNPASETANIEFSLVAAKHVIISVRNMVGQDVLLVADQHLEAGEHKFTFAASDKLPAGMYFVTLLVGNQLLSQKMMVR